MATSLVGLDIGRRSMRAVEIENPDKARPLVTRVHEVALPEGAVNNGEVRETNTVTSAIRKLWSEGGFKSKKVIIGIGNQRVIARDLTMPKLASLMQIREALPFQVQELLPVPVNEALLDFYPISESQGENGPVVNGLLIAAIKDAVLTNVKAVKDAGLIPVSVDLIPFALSRAVVRGPMVNAVVAIVDIGASTMNVVVTDGGVPQFVRMIPVGGDDISRALGSRLEIPPAQAEGLKMARGLSTAPPTSEVEMASMEIIRATSHELLNSLRNTLTYYINQHPTAPPQAIVIAGGGARLIGLSQALSEMTRLQVVSANAFSTVEVSKALQKSGNNLDSMTIALGLALGHAA